MPPAQSPPGRGLGPKTASARGVKTRRPNALARFQLKSFRFTNNNNNDDDDDEDGKSSTSDDYVPTRRDSAANRRSSASFITKNNNNGVDTTLPEEGSSLHHHFQTCASLSRVREELRATMEDELENKKMGFGLNCCARPEDSTGRLLAHSIGLNANLIACGGGGSIGIMAGGRTAVALSRVSVPFSPLYSGCFFIPITRSLG